MRDDQLLGILGAASQTPRERQNLLDPWEEVSAARRGLRGEPANHEAAASRRATSKRTPICQLSNARSKGV